MAINTQELERTVIAASILFPDILSEVAFLEPDDFTLDLHSDIWKHIKWILDDGLKVDISLVHSKLRQAGRPMDEYLGIIYTDTLALKGFNYISFAKSLREDRIKRELSGQEDIGKIKELISEIDRAYVTGSDLYDFRRAMDAFISDISKEKTTSLLSGFPRLDHVVGGFNKGDLIVLSARPAMGKSSLALWLAFKLAKEKKRVLYFNLEMRVENLIAKLMAAETQIDNTRFRDKNFTESNINTVLKKAGELVENVSDFRILDAGSVTTAQIENELKGGVDFVVIDQLTKIKPMVSRERKDLEIADAMFAIKEMAKSYKVPILLLHQTNRQVDQRRDQMPTLSDLRDSGAVEQDADIVMFIHRKSYYNNDEDDNRMVIKVAKNKMGATGMIGFRFLKQLSTIVEVTKEEQDSKYDDYMEKKNE